MNVFMRLFFYVFISVSFTCSSHARMIEPQYDRLVLVFIPGIYGSVLKAPDGTVLWGENGIGPKGLSLIDHPQATPELFADVRFNVALGLGKTLRGYSGFRERAALLLDRKPLIFPYDWRKSNKTSADLLQDFLCKELPKIEKPYRLVFIAHSMGGLVLRHWLKDHLDNTSDQCEGVKETEIGKIVFAGTPHLGAMETVVALLKGKTALENNPLYSSLFTGGLAAYAATFESAYELLPSMAIAGSRCSAIGELFDDRKLTLNVGTDRNRILYLDNVDKWIQLNIPEELPDGMSKDSFYEIAKDRITAASNVVCELTSKPVPARVAQKMNFIVGQMKDTNNMDVLLDNTWDWVEIKKEPSKRRTWKGDKAKGDGTVPTWSAGPPAVNAFLVFDPPQRADKEHSELLDDPLIVSHIQYIIDRVASEVAWLLPDPMGSSGATAPSYERALGEVLDFGIADYSPEIAERAVEHLAKLAENEGLSAVDIYRKAKSYTGPNSEAYKAIAFATAASRGDDLNPVSNFWAYQNSAINWLKVGNQNVAIGTALAAGEANAELRSVGDPAALPDSTLIQNEMKWRSVIATNPVGQNHPTISDVVKKPAAFDPEVFTDAAKLGYGSIKYQADKL